MHRRLAFLTAAAVATTGLGACGGGDDAPSPTAPPKAPGFVAEDPGPVHVHGLGIDPADGALFVATHTGLFRAPVGKRTAERVGDLYQDTMGSTVVGPHRFLGSGHPDLRKGGPPYLGLIQSTNATPSTSCGSRFTTAHDPGSAAVSRGACRPACPAQRGADVPHPLREASGTFAAVARY